MKTDVSRGPWPWTPDGVAAKVKAEIDAMPITMVEKKPMRKKTASKNAYVNVDELRVVKLPFPGQRAFSLHKYDDVFERMSPGDAVQLSSAKIGPVSGAMRSWLKRTKRKGIVRSRSNFPEQGKACVWWMAEGGKKSA